MAALKAWNGSEWVEIGGTGVSAHVLLDGSVIIDSAAAAVARGSIIVGNATPKWDELVIGAADKVLTSDGTDVSWQDAAGGGGVMLFRPVQQPDTLGQWLNYLAGGSTPNERYYCWFAESATPSYIDVPVILTPAYASGTLTIRIPILSPTVPSGSDNKVKLDIAFRRLETSDDATASHTYVTQTATATMPATAGHHVNCDVAFTSAQIDGLSPSGGFGDHGIMRIKRDTSVGNNYVADDALLVLSWLDAKET